MKTPLHHRILKVLLLQMALLLSLSQGLAQNTNVETFEDHFLVRVGLTNRSLNFNLSPRQNGFTQYLRRLWYRPGVRSNLNLGVRFKGLGLSYSFKLAQHPLVRSRTGESDYFDFRINSFGRKFGYDAYYQDYKGYFISNLDLSSLGNFINSVGSVFSGDTLLRRDDMHLQNLSTNFFYIFNDDRFSYRAAFVFDERQLKSADSFVLTGSLGWTRASADSSFIPPYDTLGFQPEAFYRTMDFYTLAFTPGYARNWVHPKGYFFAWGLSAMFGLLHYQGQAIDTRINNWNYFIKGIGRASLGYHGDRWIGSTSVSADLQANNTRFVQYRTSILDLTATVAYRFPVRWLKGRKSLIQFKKRNRGGIDESEAL